MTDPFSYAHDPVPVPARPVPARPGHPRPEHPDHGAGTGAIGGNPTAIVTGGSKGLGRAMAAALVADGWRVVIDGRHARPLDEAASATGAVPVVGDVTDPAHRAALVGTALGLGGRLDLLVNNAGALGTTPLPPLRHYPVEDLRAVLEANLVAPLALCQLALPLLAAAGGSIVNITSDAAVEAYEGWGGYGASKAALEQMSNVMAAEEPGVNVWWVDPGDMRTDMHQAAFPGEDISDRPLPSALAPALLRLITTGRGGRRARLADLLAGAGAEP
jgi:NAD(P)-dependent dehydrogenase (short-subunit alcohol dehydrogenase family)